MSLTYGFVKCRVVSNPVLKSSRHKQETQYHLHATLKVADEGGASHKWDTAINVGTNDADDLLNYRLAFDYHHPIIETLKSAAPGFHDLTGTSALPALDFLRSDVLKETGHWRESDVMDGSEQVEPLATLKRLLQHAHDKHSDVYIFGRTYKGGGLGIHDVHMNQGSQSKTFFNDGTDDDNDHNDDWQDGAVLVDLGTTEWAAYFTAFTQQLVPTDGLGNPLSDSHPVDDADVGSLIGK
ncbi:MAG: DUF2278 family protein [Isosphaeraceae bacterium]|nr:DUF2278 family protein [Isosphaeraceae bacterium]